MKKILRREALPLHTNTIDERTMATFHIDYMECGIFIDDFSVPARDVNIFKNEVSAWKAAYREWRVIDDSVGLTEAIEDFIWS